MDGGGLCKICGIWVDGLRLHARPACTEPCCRSKRLSEQSCSKTDGKEEIKTDDSYYLLVPTELPASCPCFVLPNAAS
eukprot:1140517-Pelagomonas_calceolata.AAC.3